MAQKYGNTWWGNYWLKSLNNIDYQNRIPRGASYARKGNVKEIKINNNIIVGKVQGSRIRPYSITIIIPPFIKEQIDKLMEQLLKYPAIISKLLNRELDHEILNISEKCGLKVFPSSWTDFNMQCNCPDWAVPCKHLAAVIYMMSREIDNNPFLVFEMHNVNLITELHKRGIDIETSSKESGVKHISDLLILKSKEEISQEITEFKKFDFSTLQDIGDSLVQLLPNNPSFATKEDFKEQYSSLFHILIKNTRNLFKKNLDPLLIVNELPNFSISTHDKIEISINLKWKGIVKSNSEIDNIKDNKYSAIELIALLLSIPRNRIKDYDYTVIALHQGLMAALHLLSHGAIVPQIVMLDNKGYIIRWLPAYMDTTVHRIVEDLEAQLPHNIIHLDNKIKKAKGLSIYLKNQAETLLAYYFNFLIPILSKKIGSDSVLSLFFGCEILDPGKVGETELAGAIKSWIDRYYITRSEYYPVFIVTENKNGQEFNLDIEIEKTIENKIKSFPLNSILTATQFKDERFLILRELSLLSALISGLDEYINNDAKNHIIFDQNSFVPFLLNIIPAIKLLNVKVLLPKSLQQLLRPKISLELRAKSNSNSKSNGFVMLNDILSFDWQIALGDNMISQETFNQMQKGASRLLKYKQSYIYVDENDIQKIQKALTNAKSISQMKLLQIALSEEYDTAPVTLTDEVKQLIKNLTEHSKVALPKSLNATLRPYQERGYSWMYCNMRVGFGSIIADDMGLGKTLQVIALILKLKEEALLLKEKVLIVVPTGLLTNWQAEFEKFAPTITFHIYHGSSRELKEFNADVMLTTYGVLRSDVALLKKMKWYLMVIDEAQNIKNEATATSKAVRNIAAHTHIAMSGTPVENRLSEFWSIMDFANKGYLGNVKTFKTDFADPIQDSNDMTCVNRFRRITAPFMMRRLKCDKTIISDLPDKIEQDEYAILSGSQAALYQQTVYEAMNEIEGIEATDHESLFVRQGLVLQLVLALKQICNHPTQYLKNGIFDSTLSGKTQLLLDLVESIIDRDEKLLIFTQFREMGEMLQLFIEERLGVKPMFYHGGCSIKERENMVNRFQKNNSDRIFLLSLKAAGTGLNLTAASHVIHYDLWWNPAVEAQATDRAYRIGQNKNVIVHRFITKNTFEEKINLLIQKKKKLADLTVASGENWIGKLSNTELRELFC